MCRRLRWNAAVYDVADRVLAIRARQGCDPRFSGSIDGPPGPPTGARILDDYVRARIESMSGASPPGPSSSDRPTTAPSRLGYEIG
jgi:hypothetical protein